MNDGIAFNSSYIPTTLGAAAPAQAGDAAQLPEAFDRMLTELCEQDVMQAPVGTPMGSLSADRASQVRNIFQQFITSLNNVPAECTEQAQQLQNAMPQLNAVPGSMTAGTRITDKQGPEIQDADQTATPACSNAPLGQSPGNNTTPVPPSPLGIMQSLSDQALDASEQAPAANGNENDPARQVSELHLRAMYQQLLLAQAQSRADSSTVPVQDETVLAEGDKTSRDDAPAHPQYDEGMAQPIIQVTQGLVWRQLLSPIAPLLLNLIEKLQPPAPASDSSVTQAPAPLPQPQMLGNSASHLLQAKTSPATMGETAASEDAVQTVSAVTQSTDATDASEPIAPPVADRMAALLAQMTLATAADELPIDLGVMPVQATSVSSGLPTPMLTPQMMPQSIPMAMPELVPQTMKLEELPGMQAFMAPVSADNSLASATVDATMAMPEFPGVELLSAKPMIAQPMTQPAGINIPLDNQPAAQTASLNNAVNQNPVVGETVLVPAKSKRQADSFDMTVAPHAARLTEMPDPLSPMPVEAVQAKPIQSASVQPTEKVEVPAPRSGMAERVMAQIVAGARLNLGDGHQEVTVRLDPPELGTIRLQVVSRGADGVSARIETANPLVRELLNGNLSEMRRSLESAGINVGQCSVMLNMNVNQQDRQSLAQGSRSGQGSQRNRTGADSEVESVMAPVTRRSAGVLDYLA